MSQHLIKLCVGIDDVEHLEHVQARRLSDARRRDPDAVLRHVTRNAPRRTAAVVDGGSIFWVIKGFIRARQRILGIEAVKRDDGRPACALVLDPDLVRTELRSFRPFQGWRYLAAENAPPDAAVRDRRTPDAPEALVAELKHLGLL